MLLIDIYRYIKRRADKRPVYLKNLLDQSCHHGTRSSEPSVSIIVPTRDRVELLRACIESVIEKTKYKNFDIIVVDNQSVNQSTIEYFAQLSASGIKILKYSKRFNYAAICNLASRETSNDLLCLLNNDTEIINGDWLDRMVDHAVHDDVGLVGSLLLYPNQTIQHAGIALGHTGVAGHAFRGIAITSPEMHLARKSCYLVSGVTFAAVLVRRDFYERLGGLDESLKVGLNDVDFCVRTNLTGKKIVLCTSARLLHHESRSRKAMYSPVGAITAAREIWAIFSKHRNYFVNDKYFEKLPYTNKGEM